MSISSHLGIFLLVIVGTVTILGVVIMAAIETKRMENDKPSLLSKNSSQTASKNKEQK